MHFSWIFLLLTYQVVAEQSGSDSTDQVVKSSQIIGQIKDHGGEVVIAKIQQKSTDYDFCKYYPYRCPARYTSELSYRSSTTMHVNGYTTLYEAIQIHVLSSGIYEITTENKIWLEVSIYEGTFSPESPERGLLASDNLGNEDGSLRKYFKLRVYLSASLRGYTLVVSTDPLESLEGPFTIIGSPGIIFNHFKG